MKAPAKEINIVSSGAKQVTDGYAEDIGKVQTKENLIYVIKKGAYSRTFAYTDPLLTTDTKVSWSAKGGAVTVKNGVMYGRSLSKKNTNGAYVPSVITVKCGKAKETFSVIVIE